MRKKTAPYSRRSFLKTTVLSAGAAGFSSLLPANAWAIGNADEGIHVLGPREGYAPQVGTLVSMMNWMRMVVLASAHNLTMDQLDHLHDQKSNSIGAMLMHLAATERYYQLNTFEGKKWGSWDNKIKEKWDVPMGLGNAGRNTIKGNNLNYYFDALKEVRETSLRELKNRDDKWLMAVDKDWPWGPTNNYCKWFHVVEHESNHNGQIKWIKSRLPGAKTSAD